MEQITTHDPTEYIRGIQQILISDKKRIGFLFGAGSSLATKNEHSLTVPAIGQMTTEIVNEINALNPKFGTALDEIKSELGENKFNVETLLSNLDLKMTLIGDNELNSLTCEEFNSLILLIKKLVREKVNVHKVDKNNIVEPEVVNQLVHSDFAKWIAQADRKYPIEIFTTNYDFLFELGLEHKEVPYYDGFCGSLRPFFNPESVEDLSFLSKQTKLWKIHGSLGWHYDKKSEKILRTYPDDDDILIYPSSLKYKDSKKQPYESLLDRLSTFLKADDSILITCGYSWGDEHINSRIISALKTNTTSHVICLYFDKYNLLNIEDNIAKLGLENSKLSIYGMRSAIIGCRFGKWTIKSEPSKDDTINLNIYFDEDPPIMKEIEIGESRTGEEEWNGKGEFILPDFSKLVIFLNSMISDNEIKILGQNVKK